MSMSNGVMSAGSPLQALSATLQYLPYPSRTTTAALATAFSAVSASARLVVRVVLAVSSAVVAVVNVVSSVGVAMIAAPAVVAAAVTARRVLEIGRASC